MKRLVFALLLIVFCAICAPAQESVTLSVMSINLRHNSDWWEERFPLIADEIARLKPDLIGLQEVEIGVNQSRVLLDLVAERDPALKYEFYEQLKTGVDIISGEGVAIFSRYPMTARKMRDLQHGRPVVAARIQVSESLSVDFFNTHLHHQGGDEVRLPQAQKVTDFMDKLSAGRLAFLTGDMNARDDSQTIAHYLASGLVDAFTAVHGTALGPDDMTSPIFLVQTPVPQSPANRIDYVFYRQPENGPRVTKVRRAEVCFRNHNEKGLYPSDHLGVIAEFEIAAAPAAAGAANPDPSGPVLYIFAHQDDESLIIAKMRSDARSGRIVHAIWITDGSGTADPVLREAESRGVMKHIGVPDANIHFLGFKDRESWKSLPEVHAAVLRIANAVQPVEIVANAYEGGNIDHDVASLMGTLTAKAVPSVRAFFEFPLYNSWKGQYQVNKFIPHGDAETLYTPLDAELGRLKMEVIEMYPTQAEIVDTLKLMIDKNTLKKYGEPYRPAPAHDYMQRPMQGALLYEGNARNPVSFDDWLSAVGPFLQSLK